MILRHLPNEFSVVPGRPWGWIEDLALTQPPQGPRFGIAALPATRVLGASPRKVPTPQARGRGYTGLAAPSKPRRGGKAVRRLTDWTASLALQFILCPDCDQILLCQHP